MISTYREAGEERLRKSRSLSIVGERKIKEALLTPLIPRTLSYSAASEINSDSGWNIPICTVQCSTPEFRAAPAIWLETYSDLELPDRRWPVWRGRGESRGICVTSEHTTSLYLYEVEGCATTVHGCTPVG